MKSGRMTVVQTDAGIPDQGRETRWTRSFSAGDLATRTVLAELRSYLTQMGAEPQDQETVELILAESLNNVFEHAYSGQPGPVEMLIDIKPTGIDCLLCDQGRTMPFGRVPEPAMHDLDQTATLPEGGFGWHIIRCLSTDLHYIRSDGWNRLSFRIPFDESR